MSHSHFGSTIDSLIQDQTGFIEGIKPNEFQGANIQGGATPELNQNFSGTLSQGLQGGFRSDTGAAAGAATAAADLQLKNVLAQIAEGSAAKGLTGSSAQSQQGLTAGVDLATLLGDRLAQIEFQADEAAAGRRVGSLGAALGEGSFLADIFGKQNAFALGKGGLENEFNLDKGQLDLQALLGQSGAGQDLLSSLLAKFGGNALGGGGGGFNFGGGGGSPLGIGSSTGGGSFGGGLGNLGTFQGIGAGIAPDVGNFGINANTNKLNEQSLLNFLNFGNLGT